MNKLHVLNVVPFSVGCSPPAPLAHGRISPYSNGSVGAILTFHCDTGYMPQAAVTSTCSFNSSWVPLPQCKGTGQWMSILVAK